METRHPRSLCAPRQTISKGTGPGAALNIGLGPSKPTVEKRSDAVSGLYYRSSSAQHVAS
eukprot:47306-Rhodomonas_salina.1